MKAAVVTSFTEPLQIRDVPVPMPGPGQVLVRIEASGLCHTDIHAARGDWPVKPTLPLIPGHEGVGIIEGVGAGVAKSRVGQRVAIAWLGWACGYCEFCVSGHETLCESQKMSGYSIDGAYAEYAVASSDFRGARARGNFLPRGGAPELRRSHHVQGGQGFWRQVLRSRRGVRHRGPGSPSAAVREDRGGHGRRGRSGRSQA